MNIEDGGIKVETKFKRIVLENSDAIVQMWMDNVRNLKDENYTTNIGDELYESTNREFMNVIFTSIQSQGSMEEVEQFSEKIINLGSPAKLYYGWLTSI